MVTTKQVSGNGPFTKKAHNFFKANYKFLHSLLTTSCTDALEMAAILANIQPGDEVIVPGFTFPSTGTNRSAWRCKKKKKEEERSRPANTAQKKVKSMK